MRRAVSIVVGAAFAVWLARPANAFQPSDVYAAVAVVTGQGEANRRVGFAECFDRVLTRVSGDSRLAARPEAIEARDHAADYLQGFFYRDRLEGRPVHDEQGTYDRPHDLTCRFKPEAIDAVLARLGSRPWLARRPTLGVVLFVERPPAPRYVAAANVLRDYPMRQAFAAASDLIALDAVFPPEPVALALSQGGEVDPSSPQAVAAARAAGADAPLVGRLTWSDADFGWIATWRIDAGGVRQWSARGVNFDEAFRVGLRGAAQALSGSGTPD